MRKMNGKKKAFRAFTLVIFILASSLIWSGCGNGSKQENGPVILAEDNSDNINEKESESKAEQEWLSWFDSGSFLVVMAKRIGA